MKKYIVVLLLIVFITPSIALASWWNPFTWKIFNKKINNIEQVENITKEVPFSDKTEELKIATLNPSESKLDKYLQEINDEAGVKYNLKTETTPTVNKINTGNTKLDKVQQYKELLILLENDKTNFQLLEKSFEENKNKSINLATSSLNEWVDLIDTTSSSLSDSTNKKYLLSSKDYIKTDIVDLTKGITDSYDTITSILLHSPITGEKKIDTINSLESRINKCIVDNYTSSDCQIDSGVFSIATSQHNLFLSTLNRSTDSLIKINNLSLDLIQTHLTSAKDEYTNKINLINSYDKIIQNTETQLNQLNAKIKEKNAVETISSIKCKTEASGGLFYKTYKTICTPENKTPKQICDEQMGYWASTGAQYGFSKPTCGN